jgi:hypothetical protein
MPDEVVKECKVEDPLILSLMAASHPRRFLLEKREIPAGDFRGPARYGKR